MTSKLNAIVFHDLLEPGVSSTRADDIGCDDTHIRGIISRGAKDHTLATTDEERGDLSSSNDNELSIYIPEDVPLPKPMTSKLNSNAFHDLLNPVVSDNQADVAAISPDGNDDESSHYIDNAFQQYAPFEIVPNTMCNTDTIPENATNINSNEDFDDNTHKHGISDDNLELINGILNSIHNHVPAKYGCVYDNVSYWSWSFVVQIQEYNVIHYFPICRMREECICPTSIDM